jgi:hypothetical protein
LLEPLEPEPLGVDPDPDVPLAADEPDDELDDVPAPEPLDESAEEDEEDEEAGEADAAGESDLVAPDLPPSERESLR